MALGKIIEFSEDVRKLYSRYKFEYFLNVHFREHKYPESDIQKMRAAYKSVKRDLKREIKKDRRQALYRIEGMIRKSHSGGFLPALFNLDDGRGSGGFLDFEEIGKTWAYFDLWSKAERKRIFYGRFWDFTIRAGAILGFALTIIKIIEELRKTP